MINYLRQIILKPRCNVIIYHIPTTFGPSRSAFWCFFTKITSISMKLQHIQLCPFSFMLIACFSLAAWESNSLELINKRSMLFSHKMHFAVLLSAIETETLHFGFPVHYSWNMGVPFFMFTIYHVKIKAKIKLGQWIDIQDITSWKDFIKLLLDLLYLSLDEKWGVTPAFFQDFPGILLYSVWFHVFSRLLFFFQGFYRIFWPPSSWFPCKNDDSMRVAKTYWRILNMLLNGTKISLMPLLVGNRLVTDF